jgi:hypothetical protein
MMHRLLVSSVAFVAFVVAAGVSPAPSPSSAFTYPAVASAAGTCSLAPLVCANDSSPGCETICGGMQQAVCVEGSCSPAGNIQSANQCFCR